MFNLDCAHISQDEDSTRCAITGWIFDCPDRCECYKDYFGREPYKEDIEAKLRGE